MSAEVESLLPKARSSGLVVEEVVDEVLVYELETHQARLLSPQTAKIWRLCDGQQTIEDIAEELAVAQSVVEETIQELFAAELLDASPEKSVPDGECADLSRRSVLTQGAAATLFAAPAIVTISIPTAAAALSPLPGQGNSCNNEAACGVPKGANGLCCVGKVRGSPGRCCPPDPNNPVKPVSCPRLKDPIPRGCVQ
jgi:hypothetical protein